MKRFPFIPALAFAALLLSTCASYDYDIVIRGGTIYDGSGSAPYTADLAIKGATITDHATFEQPHQYATGVIHVFVNGDQVLENGEHTGATPGRFVKGPGWERDAR